MEPIRQLSRKVKSIFKYIMFYMVISFICILCFALIYKFWNINQPIKYSIEVFWDISDGFKTELFYLNTIEVIISNLFSAIIVSSVLLKFLKPLNPIIISDYVAYNSKRKWFRFCYWIMLPEGNFLFDICAQIFLTTREAHQEGVNSLCTVWKSNDKRVTRLKQARGIRYV